MIHTEKKTYALIAVLLGIAASLLAVMAVAVYEGYITSSWADNLTDGELGFLSALAVVGAVGMGYVAEKA